ncbi:anti-sigma factor family protein [Parasedimentitalea maritima]|uniref:Transmembrane transcriptional regulator (Anti-sigma factor RsiW) n=1 Tax=Parasedimentitalea maritima TaxID=2578117 RepID=A0A6A4RFL3_9RHOB|nr:hypothetical protein [Zongyanglinia marina]KAE9629327.1 hypothetical protein GP644_13000 [Zongyanglinia marina]
MSDAMDRDWDLISAYSDDELTPAQRTEIEARLPQEPALQKMLEEIRMVSGALSGLKPDQPTARAPANTNWRPMALCASIAVVFILAGTFLFRPAGEKTPMEWHQSFLLKAYELNNLPTQVGYNDQAGIPDLELANLYLVEQKQLPKDQVVAHYSGRNNCRLTILSGPHGSDLPAPNSAWVSQWNTVSGSYTILATGMDQRRFDAVSDFVQQATRSNFQPATVLAMKMATDAATPCQKA